MHKPQKTAPICRRCGQCCLAGGPALHREDLALVRNGTLARRDLVCLRAGEYARDDITGKLAGLDREIVKIGWAVPSRPQAPYACRFHAPKDRSCRIHAARPAECRALFCEDTGAVRAMYAKERLTRKDLTDTSGGLWELIVFHDRTFPAAHAARLARRAASGDRKAEVPLEDAVMAEASFRRTFLERCGADPGEMDFLFGRSLERLAAQFGWICRSSGEK